MPKALCLTGQRFGRLLVLERVPSGMRGVRWRCACDCGGQAIAMTSNLRRGNTTSCGCRQREVTVTRCTTHGCRKTAEYSAWSHMLRRCADDRHDHWKYYGGRGIGVCERWLRFQNFLADMGPKPSPLHSLDRIDGNSGYEPDNCRWATLKQQARNRRSNLILSCDGATATLADWADMVGVRSGTIRQRLKRSWSIHDALTIPAGGSRVAVAS